MSSGSAPPAAAAPWPRSSGPGRRSPSSRHRSSGAARKPSSALRSSRPRGTRMRAQRLPRGVVELLPPRIAIEIALELAPHSRARAMEQDALVSVAQPEYLADLLSVAADHVTQRDHGAVTRAATAIASCDEMSVSGARSRDSGSVRQSVGNERRRRERIVGRKNDPARRAGSSSAAERRERQRACLAARAVARDVGDDPQTQVRRVERPSKRSIPLRTPAGFLGTTSSATLGGADVARATASIAGMERGDELLEAHARPRRAADQGAANSAATGQAAAGPSPPRGYRSRARAVQRSLSSGVTKRPPSRLRPACAPSPFSRSPCSRWRPRSRRRPQPRRVRPSRCARLRTGGSFSTLAASRFTPSRKIPRGRSACRGRAR